MRYTEKLKLRKLSHIASRRQKLFDGAEFKVAKSHIRILTKVRKRNINQIGNTRDSSENPNANL